MHVALMLLSATVIGLLGAAHLLLTFRGPALHPRDQEVTRSMEQTAPVITGQTTMWKAWLGFNASHGLGALLFGVVYGYLAVSHTEVLFSSQVLLGAGFLALLGYLVLAIRYWFIKPLVGIAVSLACFAISTVHGIGMGIVTPRACAQCAPDLLDAT